MNFSWFGPKKEVKMSGIQPHFFKFKQIVHDEGSRRGDMIHFTSDKQIIFLTPSKPFFQECRLAFGEKTYNPKFWKVLTNILLKQTLRRSSKDKIRKNLCA